MNYSLEAHLLAKSIQYWAGAKVEGTHPLDFYAAIQRPEWAISYTHDEGTLRRAVAKCVSMWHRPISLLNVQSLVWSVNKFSISTLTPTLHIMDKTILTSLPINVIDELTMVLAELEASLLAKDPKMPYHLAESRRLLKTYPETVALLEDTEIALIISGAQIHSQIEITKAAAGRTATKKKITADDL
jgi:hypothetical protein